VDTVPTAHDDGYGNDAGSTMAGRQKVGPQRARRFSSRESIGLRSSCSKEKPGRFSLTAVSRASFCAGPRA